MILIYVVLVSWGSYDEETTLIWYVSLNRKDAVDAAKAVDVPDDNRYISLETWGGGRKIKEEEIEL